MGTLPTRPWSREQRIVDGLLQPSEIDRPPPARTARPRRRVIVSAFATAASGGSELAIGWNLCRHLATHHDVTVLCTPRIGTEDFRSRNDAYFQRHGPVEGLTLHYVEPPLLSRWLQRDHMAFLKPFYYQGYAAWQRTALAAARSLHAERPFSLAHQLNFTSFREPGYLWKLDIPFVWGPIGGAANFPRAYLGMLGPREGIFYRLKNLSNELQKRLASRPRRAARRAVVIWTIGDENRDLAVNGWGVSAKLACESGCAGAAPDLPTRTTDAGRPLRIAWSGLHIGRKGLPILLRALAMLPADVAWRASILGDGSQRAAWHRLAESLGINDRIDWLGSLLHRDAVRRMSDCDVLAFTSVQEGTPVTVVESLELGMPVICHDCCGLRFAITDECGIRVPLHSIEASVDAFARSITELARDRGRLRALSDGARRRAGELTWAKIAEGLAQDYEAAWSGTEAVR
jgi:glycosyltransferase involved in cell wall biosynthesis